MKKLTIRTLIAATLLLAASGVALADNDDHDCSLKTLQGRYVFTASGYNVVAGVPQPKAIIEVIDFNGDGTLSVPFVTRSVNGVVAQLPAGGTATYTVDAGCAGTITFLNGTSFDIVISGKADQVWMIQTNQNSVFLGTATRTSR